MRATCCDQSIRLRSLSRGYLYSTGLSTKQQSQRTESRSQEVLPLTPDMASDLATELQEGADLLDEHMSKGTKER